jgi:hypothetical protein
VLQERVDRVDQHQAELDGGIEALRVDLVSGVLRLMGARRQPPLVEASDRDRRQTPGAAGERGGRAAAAVGTEL